MKAMLVGIGALSLFALPGVVGGVVAVRCFGWAYVGIGILGPYVAIAFLGAAHEIGETFMENER